MGDIDLGNFLSITGGAFLQRLPMLLVILAGLAFCFFNLKTSPAASRMTLIGLIILLISNIVSVFLPVLFTQMALSYRDDLMTYGIISIAVGFVFSLIGSIGLGLIIYSVWVGRKTV
jgi:hypothetical protein